MAAFDERFRSLTGHMPLPWQRRLFERHMSSGRPPAALDLPTGLGKTSVMAIWYLALEAGADLPRRLVYVVDRRAVVDQATDEAEKIKKHSGDPDLRISTLRGQFADNREWLEDPASPAIIVGTVDMIGSRLLFEGYGVSRGMRPFHAGLLGTDTLVVLDESHLVPPFERLLEQVAGNAALGPKAAADRLLIPGFHLLSLSATGRERDGESFRLDAADRNDPVVAARLGARKCLTFEPVGGGKRPERLAEEAWACSGGGTAPARVLVYCNSREVAEATLKKLRDLSGHQGIPAEHFQLFVGARRVRERESARNRLKALGFFSGDAAPGLPAFVVATSAGEVGVDLDADHLVMDLVPFERMVQRLGRVNRLGRNGHEAHITVIDEPDKAMPEDLARRARSAAELLADLRCHEDGSHDASPGALLDLRQRAGEQRIREASSPVPLHPALSRPLLDAWSMTSLDEHTGRPEVQPWLRGWETDDRPQTTLVWRRHLPVRTEGGPAGDAEIGAFFAAAPPHLAEKLETESHRVHAWLKARVTSLLKQSGKGPRPGEAGPAAPDGPPGRDEVVAFVLGRGNESESAPLSLADVEKELGNRDRFQGSIAGRTLVLDARISGLSDDGLLDDAVDGPVSAADMGGWPDAENAGLPQVAFRVRHVEDGGDPGDEPVPGSGAPAARDRWLPIHDFVTRMDDEGNAAARLVVETWRGESTDEDSRAVARRAQTLVEHQDWVARRAKDLVGRLGLGGELADAIVIAARLHDEGKRARRWQDAFHTARDGRPFAKTGSRRPPDLKLLDHYRHEFGSLFHLDGDREFDALSDGMKELVRHLVAAHHGQARPVIRTDGCDAGPPSRLAAVASDVALRFARLQKRFGPWGLAWLEAVLRAADQQASRDLEKETKANG
ncbi:MAG: type I-U CRISPR-associated helicase/endonuclease Cas3 [Pseudomonadota bacterium]|nr:type I-U CRISPR-associated helicase/endonuclease Cas3 [Pseudomonadota bacterium]